MDTLRERRVVRIVEEALPLRTAERAAYLDEQCAGDTALRERVEGADVEQWTLGTPDAVTAIRESARRASFWLRPGETIGAYRLGAEIGAEGTGVVYEAHQAAPRRTVALKVLHARLVGSDTGRRFALEAEILGRLNHPHVAQVYEAGTCDVGEDVHVPWFAMERVRDARRITDYCRGESLLVRERLRLFVTVCEAVQHAHCNGLVPTCSSPARGASRSSTSASPARANGPTARRC